MIDAVDVHLNVRLMVYHTQAHDREKEVFEAILDLLKNNLVLRVP